jgi:hypothetical protein
MRVVVPRLLIFFLVAVLSFANSLSAQQAPDQFRWVNFHSSTDNDVVAWVTRSLEAEHWTSISEIGVEYDAALVVTMMRPSSQALPSGDLFTVWSASLTSHVVTPLITGVNLRFVDWLRFSESAPRELGALYNNCAECAADTYFTAFHYDVTQHAWSARWLRGGQTAPIWSANPPDGVTLTQVYAAMADPNGREFMATWSHFNYGNEKSPADFIYRYDLDAYSGLEHTQPIVGKDAEGLKLRLCSGQGALPGLARGQDSALCQQLLPPPRTERKPVTTPPANNHGKSVPPGAHH